MRDKKEIALKNIRESFFIGIVVFSLMVVVSILNIKELSHARFSLSLIGMGSIYLLLLLGLRLKRSRVCAVLIFGFYAFGLLRSFGVFIQRPIFFLLLLVVGYYFFLGVRGTFLYHKVNIK